MDVTLPRIEVLTVRESRDKDMTTPERKKDGTLITHRTIGSCTGVR
jgi:hypothetical protein